MDGKEDLVTRTADGALVVFPHSGGFDGVKTLKNGVPINYGWGNSAWISAADFTGGNIRMYPHSGRFDGTNTLGPREVNFTGDGLADLLVVKGDGKLEGSRGGAIGCSRSSSSTAATPG
ncbi:hypothetical protein [Amycolatopsis minnesotensis]|uniref:Repeat domain-containing protein n=1 Tax=Amycolatopsis minnesotensis TaxID=337894 RepID=A0ABN2RP22_9PSEU